MGKFFIFLFPTVGKFGFFSHHGNKDRQFLFPPWEFFEFFPTLGIDFFPLWEYNHPVMTIDEIKTELERRGWSYVDLAQKLAVGKSSIYRLLKDGVGAESLRRHIELVLSTPESAILIYKVNLTERQVYDLTAQQQFPSTEEGQKRRAEAVEAVIRHNMQMLEQMGRTANLGPELRYAIKVLDENLPKKEGEK